MLYGFQQHFILSKFINEIGSVDNNMKLGNFFCVECAQKSGTSWCMRIFYYKKKIPPVFP